MNNVPPAVRCGTRAVLTVPGETAWSAAARASSAVDALLVLGVFLAPLAGWIYKVFVRPRPYWATFYDPEVIYFYDSVRLLEGQVPQNVDHPATPVQIIGALIVLLTGRDPFDIDRFRLAGYAVLMVLSLGAAFLLHRTVLSGLPPGPKMGAIAVFLAAPTALQWNSVWLADSFYLPAGALVLAASWEYFHRSDSTRNAAIAGAALGLAVSVQFLFLPWIPALLLAVLVAGRRSQRERFGRVLAAASGTLLAFAAVTLPILSEYPRMFHWLWKLTSRHGEYGTGGEGVVNPEVFLHGLWRWVLSAKPWHAAVWISLALVLLGVYKSWNENERRFNSRTGLALFAAAAFILSSVAGLKAAEHLRYFLPAALAGVVLFAEACGAGRIWRSRRAHAVIGWLAVLLVAKHELVDVRWHESLVEEAATMEAMLKRAAQAKEIALENSVVVYGWRWAAPSAALRMVTADETILRRIESRFPKEGHFNRWDGRLYLPSGHASWDVAILESTDLVRIPAERTEVLADIGSYRFVRNVKGR